MSALVGTAVPPMLPGDATAARAAELMQSRSSSCVLVVDGERLAGIFTERDLLRRVAAEGRDPTRTALSEVMTPDPETLHPEDCVSHAINRMAFGGFRNVPVLDHDGAAVASLSVRDVIGHLSVIFDDLEDEDPDPAQDEWTDIGGGG